MTRSPLALAALATVAVPGLDVYDVRRPIRPGTDLDRAVVIDAAGTRWVVRAPLRPAAGAALEAELALLEHMAEHADSGTLPFDVPRPAGFAHLPEGGRAVVHREVPGRPVRLDVLAGGPGLAAEIGRALAALHELPVSVADAAGVPSYDARAYRERRLAEVDDAARTGKVPSLLLRRWERMLEDVSIWRFQPTLTHGDLNAGHVLTDGTRVTGILDWGEAKVADPADDLSWLLVAAPTDAVDSICEAYQLRRTELKDPHLTTRALLAGELALARWLLYGVRAGDAEIIADAEAMLADLAEHVLEDEAVSGPDPVAEPSAGEDSHPDASAWRAGDATIDAADEQADEAADDVEGREAS